jgi:adenylate cyclase
MNAGSKKNLKKSAKEDSKDYSPEDQRESKIQESKIQESKIQEQTGQQEYHRQTHLFEKEETVIQKAEVILTEPGFHEAPLHKEYIDLLEGYRRMYKQLKFLVKMSDKQQLRLNQLNEKLELRNRFIEKTFGRYVSDDVAREILESPKGALIGGEKRIVSLLISDLRGFTSITETLSAEQTVHIVNIYLETMIDIVFKYEGTIDEFLGDGLLAVFGAPAVQQNHAQRAVACAVEMQQAMKDVNRKNHLSGLPELEMGIGVNTGELVVGNIGSTRRTKYGVVGSHVNLTSRIESYTVGGQVFASENTANACGDLLEISEQIDVMPKGVKKPITIYDISGIRGEFNLSLPEKQEKPLYRLKPPVAVKFSILSGKHAGRKRSIGELTGFNNRNAEIVTEQVLPKLTNLKISVFGEKGKEEITEMYAKVIRIYPSDPPVYRIHITSIPPEEIAILERLTATIPEPSP